MKWIFVLLSLMTAGMVSAGEVGNGGDPLRLLFEEARKYAAERVQTAKECAFSANTNPKVIAWIMEHKDHLASDILMSQHVWVTDTQSTCAWTYPHAKAPITFSFETCRPGIKGISDAVAILTHESVHHFGITNESFADEVGRAIASLGTSSTCSSTPSEDPFNPASCVGAPLSQDELIDMIPLPESNNIVLGQFNVSYRVRQCYGDNWCSKWNPQTSSDVYSRGFWLRKDTYNGHDIVTPLSKKGEVKLRYAANESIVTLKAQEKTDWYSNNTVRGYDLISSYHSGDFMIGASRVQDSRFYGVITRSCLRQVATGKWKTKDDSYNDVTYEYEVVILSQFNK